MPYRRRRSYRATRRVPYKRRSRVGRRTGGYGRKPRSFRVVRQRRKAPAPRRRMKRIIKDVASIKKQDTLLSSANGTPLTTPITLSSQVNFYLWSPTYRDRLKDVEASSRNSTRCYFRGVKERWDVRVDTAGWVHRRVVFWAFLTPSESIPFSTGSVANNNIMYYRPFRLIDPSASAGLLEYLFKGTEGVDYEGSLAYNIKMDNRRLRIVSDRSRTMNAGNDSSKLNQYTMWTEINKDIVYDEEESGGTSVTSPWSVVGPNSPGNLFFFDIIYTQPLASGGATITFNTQTTVYWHEGGSV